MINTKQYYMNQHKLDPNSKHNKERLTKLNNGLKLSINSKRHLLFEIEKSRNLKNSINKGKYYSSTECQVDDDDNGLFQKPMAYNT